MRSFVAINLPEGLAAQLSALQAELRVGRHVPEDNMHLTVAFLDDQPQALLGELHEALSEMLCVGFALELSGLDLFGGKRPRLLFLRAAPAPALLDLHQKVRKAARSVGIAMPRERFRPHVTLARFRRDLQEDQARQIGQFIANHGSLSLPAFPVTKFHLYASTLHPEGAEHEVLADYPLAENVA